MTRPTTRRPRSPYHQRKGMASSRARPLAEPATYMFNFAQACTSRSWVRGARRVRRSKGLPSVSRGAKSGGSLAAARPPFLESVPVPGRSRECPHRSFLDDFRSVGCALSQLGRPLAVQPRGAGLPPARLDLQAGVLLAVAVVLPRRAPHPTRFYLPLTD